MVLTFSDWSNYVDETGSPRAIGWDDLIGYPRAAHVEAIRQAVIEKLAIFTADPMAALDAWDNFVYHQGVSLLKDPIPLGVDMDAIVRLQALAWLIHRLASLGFQDPADPLDGSMVADVMPAMPEDVWSAEWALAARNLLDACVCSAATVSDVAGDTYPVYHRMDRIENSQYPYEIGDICSYYAFEYKYAAETWAAFASRYATEAEFARVIDPVWRVFVGCRWHDFVDESGSWYRYRADVRMNAAPCARRVEVWADYIGEFPESRPSGVAKVSESAVTSEAVTLVCGDTKDVPAETPTATFSPPDYPYLSLIGGQASWAGSVSGCILQWWNVPGGFTFRSEA
jgi:hypothetical protein